MADLTTLLSFFLTQLYAGNLTWAVGGTVLSEVSQGILAMVSPNAANALRIPNGAGPEFGGMGWATNVFEVGTTTNGGTNRNVRFKAGTTGTFIFQTGGGDLAVIGVNGKFTSYAGNTVTGAGLPMIVASSRVTAQSAANASISTFTVGGTDATIEVSGNFNATAVTTLATTLSVSYTDESNTARTMILPIANLTGTLVAAGAITTTGPWSSPAMHLRCKAATTVTVFTSAGTFTGVTYTAEGYIRQLT